MSEESKDKFKIFSLNGNRPLAEKIADVCGVPLEKVRSNSSVMEKSRLI